MGTNILAPIETLGTFKDRCTFIYLIKDKGGLDFDERKDKRIMHNFEKKVNINVQTLQIVL